MGIFKKASDRLELFTQPMDRTKAKAGSGTEAMGEGNLKSGTVTGLGRRHEKNRLGLLEDSGSQPNAPAFCAKTMRLNKTIH